MSSLRRSSRLTYDDPQPSRTRSTYGSTLSISPSASRAERPGSITWVTPCDRGLGERLGRSRKSGKRSSGTGGGPRGRGIVTAVRRRPGAEPGRRGGALDRHRHVAQRPRLPVVAQQAEDVDVVLAVVVAVPAAQHALVAEAERQQRARRADVLRVRVGAEPVHAELREREVGDDRLALAVRARPPERPAEPGADHAAPVAPGELRKAGDPGRPPGAVHDEQVELLAALALAREA